VSVGSDNSSRLDELRVERRKDAFTNKLTVGPGDVIEITVAHVPELNKYKIRVSQDNTIDVPLAGAVPVGGLTEEELREALYQRLEKPVKDPQVEVFVDQYYSREVAVVGMVQKPGLYSITSRSDTILDMIDRAGGMTNEASSRLLFIPASAAGNRQRLELAKAFTQPSEETVARVEPVSTKVSLPKREMAQGRDHVNTDPIGTDPPNSPAPASTRLVSLLGATDPIDVDLTSAAREGKLDIPVRPDDTIIVPAAGEVMVDGWVANPGAFRNVPGMTALSAVSAAGGALFSQTAEVLRTDSDGSRRALVVDLSKVKSGEEADVPVQAGDVVFVRRSAVGAVPYAFYEIFTKFGTGMYLPPP
jgi:polysaccharide export outer membrane protein